MNYPENHYVGYTIDIKKRLAKHNEGGSPHTSKNKPWKIKVAIAFEEKEKALAFEKYLKTHSGRALTKIHF
jgi:predicted GIY-YIG superfamily endonuclease